jgi:hypothetical protein
MALSPNYGWSEPDNSSLVKNGAADIRTLGDSIDTSVWNVGYGQAGKNKIINGDFFWNQRNFTSFTTTSYGFDRWSCNISDGTVTYSAQTFTVGAAPVAGYEAKNYARVVTSGQTLATARTNFNQNIEDVRTFAGQTATISFWAKAATGTPKIAVELNQSFGTGGSPSTGVTTYAGQVTLSTSWARYSVTVAVPSIAGKTLGTDANSSALQCNLFVSAGSNFNSRTGSLGIQSNTFDIWGVQAEYGSKVTPFQTASGGNPQAELAMCQRYYEKSYPLTAAIGSATTDNNIAWNAVSTTSNRNYVWVPFKVVKRAAPTITVYSPITGTSGKLYNALTSAGDKNATANYIQDASFAIYLGPTDGANAVGDLLLAQYVASAEL